MILGGSEMGRSDTWREAQPERSILILGGIKGKAAPGLVCADRIEIMPAMVAAERDEMKIALAVEAFQSARH
jgi:hypothetical protein